MDYQQIKTELSIHTTSEEQTFDTAVEAAGGQMMHQSVSEHHEIADLLKVLDTAPIAGDFWMEKFADLREAVHRHVAKEENEIFAKARALLSPGQAKQLAVDMEAMKQDCLSDIEFDIPAL